MTPATAKWITELTEEQRHIALALYQILRAEAPELREAHKWNQPCFLGNAMVCYLQKAKAHVSLGFAQGVHLSDPKGLLEGSGTQLRHVKIPLGKRPDAAALAHLIAQAVERDRHG